MPLQWRNEIWESLEEGAGKRCSECGVCVVGGGGGGGPGQSRGQLRVIPAESLLVLRKKAVAV